MAHQTKTRAELEKTLFLRDNAMASVGLYDPQRDALVELGEKDEVLAPRERLLTPVWAWTFPTGANKPPVPVADGWYLISDDPGPVLRISGPFGSRAQVGSVPRLHARSELRLGERCACSHGVRGGCSVLRA
eukprot:2130699-Rhodomonas_salina.2